ncbi:putative uncharacterized protein [Prevotella sp. CAG:891]|nr:putative uncharacterized protein [Prevotella sp. CAG:891]
MRVNIGRPIGLGTKHQILPETNPRVVLSIFVHNVAQALVRFALGPLYLAIHMLCNNAQGACSAVIVEEIVTVNGIFRLQILRQSINQSLFLGWRQVQTLLIDGSSFAHIFFVEVAVRQHTQFVIGFAEHKAPHKVLLLKREGAVIKHPIAAASLSHFANAQSGMSVKLVEFRTGRAGYQTDVHRILFGRCHVLNRSGCVSRCLCSHFATHAQGQHPYYDIRYVLLHTHRVKTAIHLPALFTKCVRWLKPFSFLRTKLQL